VSLVSAVRSATSHRGAGVAVSVVSVAVVTAAIEVLKEPVPVLSLGVLYVLAVLLVAVGWGLAYAIPVAIASMLAFNWFHLPPTHTFTLADGANWFALVVYVVTAIVVSALAARVRRRAREAEQRERESALLASIASALLGGTRVQDELDRIAAGAADVLGVSTAAIELGPERPPLAHEDPYPLVAGERHVGTLFLPEREEAELSIRHRFLPALASLLAVATERERLERDALEAETLRRSDAVKTAVLRAVSHDLRTPIATMQTAVAGLAGDAGALDEHGRSELLDTLRTELGRLRRLVDNLLDLSKLQAGAARPSPELWTADELVGQALDGLAGSERVDAGIPEGLPPVSADAGQVQRVLANVLENALRVSPPGERVLVRVTATRKELLVRVVDHGPGIPEADRELIFEPFHRSGTGGAGAGLGLAIARGFAEANGGRIWVESHPGQGATFTLALPVAEVPAPVPA
jgi:two-component system sensor histidine kinase KdpD